MVKTLPARPNLDHLRHQAKSLMKALAAGEAEAFETLRAHLPAARGLDRAQISAAGFRLADAQSAVARKNGFASWPQLAHHVEQLRALEGTWAVEALEVDGAQLPPEALSTSQLLLDGDRFRFESPESNYEGVFTIDVEAEPHTIDIDFVEGPEAGRTNHGIFRVDGDELLLCLDVNGRPAPRLFSAPMGSGHACERLRRSNDARPAAVTGGTRPRPAPETCGAPPAASRADFGFMPSETLARLQGEWIATGMVHDGRALPAAMLRGARRVAKDNELRVTVGGQLMVHALTRIDATTVPIHVDYLHLGGAGQGRSQLGIIEWRDGGEIAVCMAPVGGQRPTDFTAPPGSGRMLTMWRPKP